MLKNRESIKGTSSIIAIDEPEAHIHPGAITELNKNLLALSKNNLVIVSTHNQGFINFSKIGNNIIVDSGEAKPAKSIEEIRKVLGVRVCDNLINARYVLLVEGETDVKILEKILSKYSSKIERALNERLLVIQSLDSASKLEYNLSRLNQEMCKSFVLCDNDPAGRDNISNAINSGLIDIKLTYLFCCNGMANSELEDCIDPEIYKQKIFNKYAVSLESSSFRRNLKWTDRIRACFLSSSRLIDDDIVKEIKILVANSVVESIGLDNILIEHKSDTIFNLISGIEEVL
jgi:predicted ATP-dependent endonuclease of OLD family